MQSGLIDHRAGYERMAALLPRNGQARKPIGPLVIKVSLDAKLVMFRLVVILSGWVCFTHCAAPCIVLILWVSRFAFVLFIDPMIQINVVRCHHHKVVINVVIETA